MTEGDDLTRPWGERLRWWRAEVKRWSPSEFCEQAESAGHHINEAKWSKLNEKQLWRWESGETKRPHYRYRRILAAMGAPLPSPDRRYEVRLTSRCPPETAPQCSTVEEDEGVDRRNFLWATGTAATVGTAAVGAGVLADLAEPWRRLEEVLDGSSTKPDNETVGAIEQGTRDLYDAEEYRQSAEIVEDASAHLGKISNLIARCDDESLQARLITQAGTSAALAGWLAYDQGAFALASKYYSVAERAAVDVGDAPLIACVRAYRSYLVDALGSPQDASRYIQEAIEGLPRGKHPEMRAWLSARQAEELTSLGQNDAALREFDRAFTAHEFAGTEQLIWTRFFVSDRLDGMAVAGYARMAHPDMDSMTARLLGSVGDRGTKVDSIVFADLSYAYLERGDVERGAELGQQALDSIVQMDTRVGYERLTVIDRALAPYRDARAASGLRDRLAETLHV